jgi:diadenylate cyclase
VAGVLRDVETYLGWTISQLTWISVIDILLVAAVFYAVLYAIRGTQAVQLLRGLIVIILIVLVTTSVLDSLTAFRWLVRHSITALLIAIPIVFQPELRRALERLGRAGFLTMRPALEAREGAATRVINSVSRAARELSERRYGALIVLEQQTGLQHIAETGVKLDALISTDLLINIFHPRTPLHDGAVIVRNDRIIAAAAVLPLAQNPPPDRTMGTRHLAAIGVTEDTDAIAVVVSEETGTISVARNGRMVRNLDEGRLSRTLYSWYSRRETRLDQLLGPLRPREVTPDDGISEEAEGSAPRGGLREGMEGSTVVIGKPE